MKRCGAAIDFRGWRRPSCWAAGLAGLLLAACAVGPDYHRPDPPAAPALTGSPSHPAAPVVPTDQPDAQQLVHGLNLPRQWWVVFHSEPLNALVERALRANPDIASAAAALRAAQATTAAQRGFFYPSVAAGFQPERQQLAGNLGGNSPGVQGNGTVISTYQNPNGPPYNEPVTYNFYTAQVAVSYTLDVFGQNRRNVESLEAQEDEQRFVVEATYITLATNVVNTAIQGASLRAQIAATARLIDLDRQLLAILRRQEKSGYTNSLAVLAQESQLAQTVATLPPLRRQLAQLQDLLDRLVGAGPGTSPPLSFDFATLALPHELPLSLPAELVEHRPDVRQAEENLHAACALIGVAEANRLPQFTLTASYGGTAAEVSQMFKSGGPFWTLIGNATQPIFAGGTLRERQKAAVEAFHQAREQYRGAVLTAFQNVADTLHAIDEDGRALTAARTADRASKDTCDATERQLELGYTNLPGLIAAEQGYQQAEIALVQAQANQYADTAALFEALGGGWWEPPNPGSQEPFPESAGQ